jgi:hypothetical protein
MTQCLGRTHNSGSKSLDFVVVDSDQSSLQRTIASALALVVDTPTDEHTEPAIDAYQQTHSPWSQSESKPRFLKNEKKKSRKFGIESGNRFTFIA